MFLTRQNHAYCTRLKKGNVANVHQFLNIDINARDGLGHPMNMEKEFLKQVNIVNLLVFIAEKVFKTYLGYAGTD